LMLWFLLGRRSRRIAGKSHTAAGRRSTRRIRRCRLYLNQVTGTERIVESHWSACRGVVADRAVRSCETLSNVRQPERPTVTRGRCACDGAVKRCEGSTNWDDLGDLGSI